MKKEERKKLCCYFGKIDLFLYQKSLNHLEDKKKMVAINIFIVRLGYPES